MYYRVLYMQGEVMWKGQKCSIKINIQCVINRTTNSGLLNVLNAWLIGNVYTHRYTAGTARSTVRL